MRDLPATKSRAKIPRKIILKRLAQDFFKNLQIDFVCGFSCVRICTKIYARI